MKRTKRMLGTILVVVAVLIAVIVALIAAQAPEYRVERSTRVAAPPAVLFAQVNDLHNWDAWSPWAKLDPQMQQTYEGPPSGTGAVYHWLGNKKVGEGRMTIVENRPNEVVRIKLEFLKPFAAVADTEFTFKPDGNETAVAWSMAGKKNFMAKAFHLFVNMDKMIGGDFEKGLAQLKSVAETATKTSVASGS